MMKRQTPSAPPLPSPEPAVEELEAQLANLQTERTSLARQIEAIPGREREMLEGDAPDADFAALDLERRRLHVKADRLNIAEAKLLAALAERRNRERAAQWRGFVDRYAEGMAAMVQTGRELAAHHAELVSLVNEAGAAGFSAYAGDLHLPFPPPAHNQFAIESMGTGVDRLRRLEAGPGGAEMYGLRFLQWTAVQPCNVRDYWTAYQAGQIAGFDAKTAWQLVRSQKAVWADPTRIPPPPPPAPPRQRAPDGVQP